MKILLTGARGYIGYPLQVELVNLTNHKVIGVDNDSRNEWVSNVGGKEHYKSYFGTQVIKGDLVDFSFVNELLAIHKPDCIIHLASQPSMPYSQINGERATFTQLNNLLMCLNLLWGIKENGLKSRLIVTTTTGISGQVYRTTPEDATLNQAGSWYHISRGFDSANLSLACRQWGLQAIEFRTSIVYGLQTELMRKLGVVTRFDTDTYFGTALNRFVKQAVDKKPITVYGKGKQTKPFISLEDTVQSLKNSITYKFPKGHTILNQTTESISIVNLAKMISNNVVHIPNPRKESETHKMKFENKKFLKVLHKKPDIAKVVISKMVKHLQDKNKTSWNYTI